MATAEYIKEMVQAQRTFVIFWATIFMTSMLGIIRLLSDFQNALNYSLYFLAFSCLYFVLVLLNTLSVHRFLDTYKFQREWAVDGKLGEEYKKILSEKPTIIDNILSVKGSYMKGWTTKLWILPAIFFVIVYIIALLSFSVTQ